MRLHRHTHVRLEKHFLDHRAAKEVLWVCPIKQGWVILLTWVLDQLTSFLDVLEDDDGRKMTV